MNSTISLQSHNSKDDRLSQAEKLTREIQDQLQARFPTEQGYRVNISDHRNENRPFSKRIIVQSGWNMGLRLDIDSADGNCMSLKFTMRRESKLTNTFGTVFALAFYGLSSGLLFANSGKQDYMMIGGLSMFILLPLGFILGAALVYCLQPLVQPDTKTTGELFAALTRKALVDDRDIVFTKDDDILM